MWIKNQGSKDSQALPRRAEEVRRNGRLVCPKAEVGGRSCSRGRIVKGRRVLGTGSAATVHASQPTLAVYKGLHRFQAGTLCPVLFSFRVKEVSKPLESSSNLMQTPRCEPGPSHNISLPLHRKCMSGTCFRVN